MRALAVAAVAALPLLGAALPSPVRRPAAADVAPARAAEVRRLRAHFDSVLAELPRGGAAGLTAAQRARRAALLDTLRAYRDRGAFPRNRDFPGRAVPYFVDRGTGTLCAVAYLMAASGRRDVVDRVARADNNVWVPSLAGDAAFTAWLGESGLTLAEAARIQAPYILDGSSAPAAVRSPSYTAASTAALGGAMLAAAWNASANPRGASRVGNVLGLTAGAAAVGLGAASAGSSGARPALGVANLAVGAASVWLGARGVRRHRADLVAARAREASLARRASVTPLLPAGPGGGAGAMVAMRF